jgi:TonB family protein
MKRRVAALLACGLCLAAAATAQQPPAAFSPPATLKGPCPDTPESKTAWFDPSQYPLLGSGVKVGRATSTPDPEYSESARKAKIQGTVLLALAINAEGTVDAVKVVCKLEPGLDQNAADAVKKWKFTPATKDGKPMPIQIETSINFRLY